MFEDSIHELANISDAIRNCINCKKKEQGKEIIARLYPKIQTI